MTRIFNPPVVDWSTWIFINGRVKHKVGTFEIHATQLDLLYKLPESVLDRPYLSIRFDEQGWLMEVFREEWRTGLQPVQ